MDFQDNLSNKSIHPSHPNNPINPGSVLIVRTDRLGDVVLTLPMATALKKAVPNTTVSFLVRNYTKALVERCPDVDDIRTVSDKLPLLELIRAMQGVETAFFPAPRFSHALAAFLARVPKRIGTGYRWYSFLFNHKIYEHRKTAEHHEAEYNLRMLRAIGIVPDVGTIARIELKKDECNAIDIWLREHFVSSPIIVLHTVSGGSTHPWPEENFVELGKRLSEKYGVKIVLTGTPSEVEKIDLVRKKIGSSAIAFIGNSIPELAALLQRASAVVTIGTGPGHLAAALGTPTIGLFALPKPISKERWGFRGPKAVSISPEPISRCPNCEHCTCMERIAPETVLQAISKSVGNLLPLNSSNI